MKPRVLPSASPWMLDYVCASTGALSDVTPRLGRFFHFRPSLSQGRKDMQRPETGSPTNRGEDGRAGVKKTNSSRGISHPLSQKGQATTETVLLLPIFMFFLFAFAKIFALLILVQKMEIASFYAARRWQLESHRNVAYSNDDDTLQQNIKNQVMDYLGFNNTQLKGFLNLSSADLTINRTDVWQVLTLTVKTGPVLQAGWVYQSPGISMKVVKYVPNRDRPIQFILPGSG